MVDLELTGSHLQTLDDRLRLAVPAKMVPVLRELAGTQGEDPVEVVITITVDERLGVFPKKYFTEHLAMLKKAAEFDRSAALIRRKYLNQMDEQSLDKQNRFRIPQMLAEYFGLNGEVVVVGSGEYLEVMSRERWKKQMDEDVPKLKEFDERVYEFRRNFNGSNGK